LQFPEDDFKVVAYKKEWNEESKLPADYIRREDIEIKDVAMKHVLPFLPGKSLMKFRAVSNEWNHWIVSPLVAYEHSILFEKLSSYFFQIVDVDFQSDPNFLSRTIMRMESPILPLVSCLKGLREHHNYLFCTYS